MPALMLLLFALTLLLSALLMFVLELMVGKLMLPLLGGTPAVWNTCMVFYQAVLLAGYAYAHFTTKYLGPRRQAAMHFAVLVIPLAFFAFNFVLFKDALKIHPWLVQGREDSPVLALLIVLTVCVGVPMFVVSTSAPLLSRWFSNTDHPSAKDPYFLYGASNFGSMLALAAYPTFIEWAFRLNEQRTYWAIGFAALAGLTAACAWMMWQSRLPSPEPAAPAPAATAAPSNRITDRRASAGPEDAGPGPAAGRPVTWLRRLRWLALAAVPSSLMLGATTYMSMDIAAIPLLWVLPLMLYLLTFILVFSVFSIRTQNIVTAAGLWLLLLGLGLLVAPEGIKDSVVKTIDDATALNIRPYIGGKWFEEGSSILLLIRLGVLGAMVWAGWILTLKDKELIHHVMVMVMPLLLLLLLFIMYAEINATIWVRIALHLVALFIVAMVCHGELARDRPEPEFLTDFFLTMSVGGVVGGLFNSLVAPVAFNSYIEYQLMMVAACLLVPALGYSKDSKLARSADLALAGVFFGVGALLFLAFYLNFYPKDKRSTMPDWADMPWDHWRRALVAFVPGLLFGVVAAWQGWGTPPTEEGEKPQNSRIDRALDVILPLGLLFLLLGLYWGLPTSMVKGRIESFAGMMRLEPDQFRNILTFGLPAVLCYTFVERGIRFGLGVGAIVLGASLSLAIKEGTLYQDRSFFGVLKVEEGYARNPEDRNMELDDNPNLRYFQVNRLVHGTTLHGKQFLEEEIRNLPTSYYHSTGPVGWVVRNYNTDPKRNMAVIGLGTGTVACYANPGQRLDYFDIDAVVVDITYDQRRFFTFIEDAEARGVDVGLILGDARLTFDPNNPINKKPNPSDRGVPRQKPLHKVWDAKKREYERPLPERKFGAKLQADDKYGLIFADAFSSDAIPVHLITREAVMIYLRRLHEDGIVCIHISNRYLDLQPVLSNIVSDLKANGITDEDGKVIERVDNLVGYHMSDDDETAPGKSRSHWVVIARDKKHIDKLLHSPRWRTDDVQLAALGVALWPSADAGMQAVSGMAYRLLMEADKASARAFEEEKRSGDARYSVSKWLPLDTVHDMDERNAEDEKERDAMRAELKVPSDRQRLIDEALVKEDRPQEILDIVRKYGRLEPFNRAVEEHDAENKKLNEEYKAAGENVERLKQQLSAATPATKATIQRELDTSTAALKALEPKWKAEGEKRADLVAKRQWEADRARSFVVRYLQANDRIERLEKRRARVKRVGVWTDDYSNLLSVFNR